MSPLRKGSRCHVPALCFPSEEDGSYGMQLFTYGIRKIIVCLVKVVFFALSVRVVLMKSTEDEGVSTMPTTNF